MDNTGCPYPKGGETGGVGGPRPRRARCGRAERLVGAGRGSERTRRKRAEVGISKLRWCMRGAVKERAGCAPWGLTESGTRRQLETRCAD